MKKIPVFPFVTTLACTVPENAVAGALAPGMKSAPGK